MSKGEDRRDQTAGEAESHPGPESQLPSAPGPSKEEAGFLDSLRKGDDDAFTRLVDRYHGRLLRLAMGFVRSRDVAEEVVQETWLAVLEGLDRFEGRSTLKTWIFRILINQAKTRGIRESRAVMLSSPATQEVGPDEPAVDPKRFLTEGYWAGSWDTDPRFWNEETPERLALSKESRDYIERAIEGLPPSQKQIILMRDVEGLNSKEVCNILKITETNQRVLLHRARSKVRQALEAYLEGGIGSE